jgi:PTS system ascorbate-specific IIA component
MSVGVLLITRPGIGTSMLHSARRIIADCPLRTMCIEVPVDASPERTRDTADKLIAQLDQGDGVLILTDLFGATPNNIARTFSHPGRVAVLAGLNLPMLVRVFNYPNADLKSLCDTAVQGGSRGVQECDLEAGQPDA